MELRSPEIKSDLVGRLHRIEGQVRGVEKMVQEDRDCGAILQQMSAIRSAVHNASLVLARAYAERCILEPANGDMEAMLDQLIATLKRVE